MLQRLWLKSNSIYSFLFHQKRGKHIFLSWFYWIAWILGGVRDKIFYFPLRVWCHGFQQNQLALGLKKLSRKAVEYGPHPPTTVVLSDSKDETNNEDDIDQTYKHLWIIDPNNPLPWFLGSWSTFYRAFHSHFVVIVSCMLFLVSNEFSLMKFQLFFLPFSLLKYILSILITYAFLILTKRGRNIG